MKKIAAFALALLLALCCTLACAEIKVNKKELAQNKNLDKSVTNVLILLQDGDVTRTMILGSVNSRTGYSVVAWLNPQMTVQIEETGENVALRDIYALGAKGSKGLLAVREINELLNLNISTYVALEIGVIADIAKTAGGAYITLDAQEAAALGLPEGDVLLEEEDAVRFAQLALPEDDPEYDRCYVVLFELLNNVIHSDIAKLMGAGQKLLAKMDTNLNIMSAMTLAASAQAGRDYDEIDLPQPEQVISTQPFTVDENAMREWLYKEIYE